MTLIDSHNVPQSSMKTRLYLAFCAEKTEILRHKWIESEKVGRDIGFDAALIDWIVHHRAAWRRTFIAKLESDDKA
jgi:hypothetical protein